MGNLRRKGLIPVILCMCIGAGWGTWIATRAGNAWVDFRAVYAGTRCLIHGQNPYIQADVEREYFSEDGPRPKPTPTAPPGTAELRLQSVTLYVNMPTAFVFLAPFAAFTWWPALILWMLVTSCTFLLAIFLMWDVGSGYSPSVATFLACVIAFNCESIFAGANTAGIVVGLCGIAVWCFLKDRFVWMGVLCLGLSLAVKLHDSGFIWLYFMLAGGVLRKRALQSLAITAAFAAASIAWVSHVAPNWIHDWKMNLATISASGGINEPGPSAVRDGSIYSIVDLQAAISQFRDDPHFYNMASYALCGALLLVGAIWTLRKRYTAPRAWIALAAIVPLTLLINYHRLWDAKLVMLGIPACCLLWAERRRVGRVAMLVTSAAALLTGEISLILFGCIFYSFPWSTDGIVGKTTTVMVIRPTTFALLAMGIFYLWVYVRYTSESQAAGPARTEDEARGAGSTLIECQRMQS